MTLEDAIDIVKWGPYAKGAKGQHQAEAKRREALRLVLNHPEVWDQVMWGHKA